MTKNKNHHYDDLLPRLTKKRTKCQSLDKNGTKCNHSAQIEISIMQGGLLGNLWAAVLLCSGCAVRDITTFSKIDYEYLLSEAKWDRQDKRIKKRIAEREEYNRKVHAQNELIRAKNAGEITAAELAKGIDKIFPEYAIARTEGYNAAKKEWGIA